MNSKLSYSAYEHKFKEGDIVTLKDRKELNIVEQTVKEYIGDVDCCSTISWCLTQKKKYILSDSPLKVMSCISWHMGIPFYNVSKMEDLTQSWYVGEFYLQYK